MRCPFCGNDETQVKDSRPTEDGSAIRRRRHCPACGARFTTFERVQLRELTVVKKNGRRVPFDRDKLMRSLSIALRKRPVEPERVERMVAFIGDFPRALAAHLRAVAAEVGILASIAVLLAHAVRKRSRAYQCTQVFED